MRKRILLVLVAALLLSAAVSYPADVDRDFISDDHERYLAKKYKPRYIFHPRVGDKEEDFFYMDPKRFLDKTGSELNQMFLPDNSGNPNPGPFQPDDTWKVECRCGLLFIKRKPPDFDPHEFSSFISRYNVKEIWQHDSEAAEYVEACGWEALKLAHPDVWDESRLKWHFEEDVPIFYLVELNDERNIELQYWAFSHNDRKDTWTSFGHHIVDWSRVVLVLASHYDPNQDEYMAVEPPLYAYYSAHRNVVTEGDADSPFHPRYLLWSDVQKHQLTHPIVLVSRNCHELYYPNSVFSWEPGDAYRTEGISYANGECSCRPFLIQDHVGNWYWDRVGIGAVLDPSNLVNLGNFDSPNPETPWVTFGSNWHHGPVGPFGPNGGVRFRQHNRWVSAEGDDFSVLLTYWGLIEHGRNEWQQFCDCWPFDCEEEFPDFAPAVLRPQGFDATADAYEHGCFGHFPLPVKTKFSVSTMNTGCHEDLNQTNYIAVHYMGWPLNPLDPWKQVNLWDGHDVEVEAFPSTEYYFDRRSSGSSEDHYWEIMGPPSARLPVSCTNIPPVIEHVSRGIWETDCTGSIVGHVTYGTEGLLEVQVDLHDDAGTHLASTVTDEMGFYQFEHLCLGYHTVSILTPLGYETHEEVKQIEVCGEEHEINFELTRMDIPMTQRGRGYWMHQVKALLLGKDNSHESHEDMCRYLRLIRSHFNLHQPSPIVVFNIDSELDCDQQLGVLRTTISPEAKSSMNDKARAHLTVLLLNIVSYKIPQWGFISDDSATVSQVVTYCYALITDDDPENDETAKNIAEMINEGHVVPGGLIDLTTPDIAYKQHSKESVPTKFFVYQNYPNPFNPETEIGYTLPQASEVNLAIYNLLGQRISTVVDEYQTAGHKVVRWNGTDEEGNNVASGVYFYRIQAGDFVKSKKMVLMK
jgi:hypothetical protein